MQSGVVSRKKTALTRIEPNYDAVLADVVLLVEAARYASARAVNALLTATYWSIGRRIVEQEQQGAKRAGYGEELIVRLSGDLQARFGRGFGRANLSQMRTFYLAYREILQTASGELVPTAAGANIQTTSGLFAARDGIAQIAARFALPWSHYVRLLAVRNPEAKRFYETEALRGGWTIRQLDRQIGTQFYERTALSRNKSAMLKRARPPALRRRTPARRSGDLRASACGQCGSDSRRFPSRVSAHAARSACSCVGMTRCRPTRSAAPRPARRT